MMASFFPTTLDSMDGHDGGSLQDFDIEWAFDLTAASAPATKVEMSGLNILSHR